MAIDDEDLLEQQRSIMLEQQRLMSEVYLDNSLLTKKHFVQQYVLNRANTNISSLDGKGAAEEAAKAWEYINAIDGT